MKKKNFSKILFLNKKTISNLSADSMQHIKGQGVTWTCTCGTSQTPECTQDFECTNVQCATYATEICCTQISH